MLGALLSGLSLRHWWWGSVFLLALPLVVIAIPMVVKNVPAHVAEQSEQIDNVGCVLSVFLVGSLSGWATSQRSSPAVHWLGAPAGPVRPGSPRACRSPGPGRGRG